MTQLITKNQNNKTEEQVKISELEVKLRRVTQERDVLLKATAFSSQGQAKILLTHLKSLTLHRHFLPENNHNHVTNSSTIKPSPQNTSFSCDYTHRSTEASIFSNLNLQKHNLTRQHLEAINGEKEWKKNSCIVSWRSLDTDR